MRSPTGYTPNPPNTSPWLPCISNDFMLTSFGPAPLSQIPAGSVMQIQLTNDANGNVTQASLHGHGPQGSRFHRAICICADCSVPKSMAFRWMSSARRDYDIHAGRGDSELFHILWCSCHPDCEHGLWRAFSADDRGTVQHPVRQTLPSLGCDREPDPFGARTAFIRRQRNTRQCIKPGRRGVRGLARLQVSLLGGRDTVGTKPHLCGERAGATALPMGIAAVLEMYPLL